MKRRAVEILACALIVAGCETISQSTATQGAAIGGAVGAATGAVVGHQYGESGVGMAVGTGLGTVAGSIAGSAVQSRKPAQPTPAQTASVPTKFCPIGGERYPESVKYCPIHGVELRERDASSTTP